MIPSRILLLCLLSVVSIIPDGAESQATRQFQSDFEGVSLDNWQQTVADFKKASDLLSQLDDQPAAKKDDKKDDKSSDDWLCQNLTDDLEKSWNLTVRVTERTVAVTWNMGGALYDLINCKATLLLPLSCIFNNLGRVRDILDPAIVEAYGFIKEGVALAPAVFRDARQCYNV